MTSGIRSPVAVRFQEAGIGSVASSVRRAKSSSSMRCCVPMRVALSLPERIQRRTVSGSRLVRRAASGTVSIVATYYNNSRSEEHTSELQSHLNLVCRLLLEKKKKHICDNIKLY